MHNLVTLPFFPLPPSRRLMPLQVWSILSHSLEQVNRPVLKLRRKISEAKFGKKFRPAVMKTVTFAGIGVIEEVKIEAEAKPVNPSRGSTC
jgi:hypothetical protein